MSEEQEYPLHLEVEMSGFDSRRYAVVEADSSVLLQVESTGFNALLMSLRKTPLVLRLDMRGEAVRSYTRDSRDGKPVLQCRSVAVTDMGELIRNQLSDYGVRHVGSAKDSLQLVLAERSHRVFRPDISDVKIEFAEGFGLYGNPTLKPAEITLYGPADVLEAMTSLKVTPVTIKGLNATDSYHLFLDPVWKERGDIYASTEMLTLTVPVEPFVERQFQLPVRVPGIDTSLHLRLYPDKVTVDVWIAERDLHAVSAERFEVTASYDDILSGARSLKLNLSRFPEYVRPRSIIPEEVKYVIIK